MTAPCGTSARGISSREDEPSRLLDARATASVHPTVPTAAALTAIRAPRTLHELSCPPPPDGGVRLRTSPPLHRQPGAAKAAPGAAPPRLRSWMTFSKERRSRNHPRVPALRADQLPSPDEAARGIVALDEASVDHGPASPHAVLPSPFIDPRTIDATRGGRSPEAEGPPMHTARRLHPAWRRER